MITTKAELLSYLNAFNNVRVRDLSGPNHVELSVTCTNFVKRALVAENLVKIVKVSETDNGSPLLFIRF